MFGISTGELLIILLIAVVIFGPDRLPQLARSLGKLIYQLKNSSKQITDYVENEIQQGEKTSAPPVDKEKTV